METQTNTETPTRPDNVPEKFWDSEKGEVKLDDVLTSYSNLEQRLGNGGNESTTETNSEGEGSEDSLAITPKPKGEDGGFTLTKENALSEEALALYASEYAEHKSLTDETYAVLQEAGVSRAVADSLIASQVQAADTSVADFRNGVYDSAGGEENFKAIQNWAAENLSDAEIEAFNKVVSNPNSLQEAKLAVEALANRYKASVSNPPSNQVRGDGSPVGPDMSDKFTSWAEVSAAMRDSRYDTDAGYMKQVHEKLARSPLS